MEDRASWWKAILLLRAAYNVHETLDRICIALEALRAVYILRIRQMIDVERLI